MGNKGNFQEILEEIRKDITFLKTDLFGELSHIVKRESDKGYSFNLAYLPHFEFTKEAREWMYDVFLDKIFEVDVKIHKIVSDQLCFDIELSTLIIENYTKSLAFKTYHGTYEVSDNLKYVNGALDGYGKRVEEVMSSIRHELHKSSWAQVKKLNTADYVLPIERARYVSAREELEKAKQAVKGKNWDEVLNHIRPAIELALIEKFGFTKIKSMYNFIQSAEVEKLPLPSYILLYEYYSEGNKRIHSGKLNTPYECQKALEFVAGFIDQLELIDVSEDQIEEFKQKCKFVE